MDNIKIIFRVHAIQQMFARNISEVDVREAMEQGEVIESYPDDLPYHSKLTLGRAGDRPLHVVASYLPDGRTIIVITAYEPHPSRWDHSFRKRRNS